MNDKVLILEDTDGDGGPTARRSSPTGFHVPTGLEFWGGGLFVGLGPNLVFLKDTDGDDRADFMERVVHGIDTADTHHTMNSFTLDPGAPSTSRRARSTTPRSRPVGPSALRQRGRVPLRAALAEVRVYITYSFATPTATSSTAGARTS